MSYKPKHFSTYELVDQETYELLGDNALKLFPEQLLIDIDTLRENINRKATINNWYWGGSRSQSGYRTSKSSVGSKTSQHRLGLAFDILFDGITAKKVRKHIKDNKDLYPAINRVEKDVSWVHIDCHERYRGRRIYSFMP